MAGKTKAQYETIVESLKEEVRQLRAGVVVQNNSEMTESGFLVYKDSDTNQFVKLDVKFNPEENICQIVKKTNLGKAIDVALYKLKELLTLRMVKL